MGRGQESNSPRFDTFFPRLLSNACATTVLQPLLTVLFIATGRFGPSVAARRDLVPSQRGLCCISIEKPPV